MINRLAVPSACNTGLDKFQEGEEMISLAHSFLYAGCTLMFMSMWAIDKKTMPPSDGFL